MFPSLTRTSLSINASSCQNAACPLPMPTVWKVSQAYNLGGPERQSELFDVSLWDQDYIDLMRLRGQAVYVHDRMTLDEPEISPFYVGYHGWGVSQNIMATYPGGANYTLDVGYFSLYGGERNISWASANGSAITYNCTLPDIYAYGYIPSLSYGLHIGSVSPNITGSLVLGGYDSSRVLTQPPTSTTSSLTLTDISLDVTRGGYAWQNAGSPGPIPNLLRANGSRIASLQVQPRPGVAYMYLPRQTCDAIANQLPVTYNEAFNFYFWHTESQWYRDIITSPHYLSFSFAESPNTPINIPFALLNLTLTSPLTSSTTQYFPCSPSGSPGTWTLGNAFLQAAFLGQNWETQRLFRTQAPGPDFLPVNRQTGLSSDERIAPTSNPPDWESTVGGDAYAVGGGCGGAWW